MWRFKLVCCNFLGVNGHDEMRIWSWRHGNPGCDCHHQPELEGRPEIDVACGVLNINTNSGEVSAGQDWICIWGSLVPAISPQQHRLLGCVINNMPLVLVMAILKSSLMNTQKMQNMSKYTKHAQYVDIYRICKKCMIWWLVLNPFTQQSTGLLAQVVHLSATLEWSAHDPIVCANALLLYPIFVCS
jgi:hypothetical protein